MAKQPASLFDDLTSLSPAQVESKYDEARQALTELEAALVELHVNKKLHSETIKFAVNKLGEPPVEPATEQDELIRLAIEQKHAFDRHLNERDDLVNRLVVPRHRVANTIGEFHAKLTGRNDANTSMSLAQEMEMFSRFFELQAMLTIYNEQTAVLANLRIARRDLLETIKSVNKKDRQLAQELSQARQKAKGLRTEAGRLRAYLKKENAGPKQPLPPPTPEMSERLLAGEALTMEEFASMLEHGGLTDVQPAEEKGNEAKEKREPAMRKAAPRRGQRHRSPSRK